MSDSDSDNIDPECENELYCQLFYDHCTQEVLPRDFVTAPYTHTVENSESKIHIFSSDSSTESEEFDQNESDMSDSMELNISSVSYSKSNLRTSSPIVCILCGQPGHTKQLCSEKYCFHCFAPGHLSCECQIKSKLQDSVCSRCQIRGHTNLICPEIWRQFKQTSEPNSPVITTLKPSGKGCCFCGNHQHVSDICPKKNKKIRKFINLPKISIKNYDKMNIYSKCEKAISKLRKKIKSSNKINRIMKKKEKYTKNKIEKPSSVPSKSLDSSFTSPLRDSIKVVRKSTNNSPGESFISLRENCSTPRLSQKRPWNFYKGYNSSGINEKPKKFPKKSLNNSNQRTRVKI